MDRLERFERMLADVTANYADTVEKMSRLKAEGKEKTATYRQLMGNKLTYKNVLTLYETYGLREEEK